MPSVWMSVRSLSSVTHFSILPQRFASSSGTTLECYVCHDASSKTFNLTSCYIYFGLDAIAGEDGAAKEVLLLEIAITVLPRPCRAFLVVLLLTVSWERANLAGITRESCGCTRPENTLGTSQPSLVEHFQRQLGVLFITYSSYWLLRFSIGRLIKPSSPGVNT